MTRSQEDQKQYTFCWWWLSMWCDSSALTLKKRHITNHKRWKVQNRQIQNTEKRVRWVMSLSNAFDNDYRTVRQSKCKVWYADVRFEHSAYLHKQIGVCEYQIESQWVAIDCNRNMSKTSKTHMMTGKRRETQGVVSHRTRKVRRVNDKKEHDKFVWDSRLHNRLISQWLVWTDMKQR